MICIISCSLSLLVIAAGMFLLAKTTKEELGKTFRWISYFIILGGFLTMASCLCSCFCRMACGMSCGGHEMQMHSRMGGGMNCMPGNCGGMNEAECNQMMRDGRCSHMGGDMSGCCKGSMKEGMMEEGGGCKMMEKKGGCKGMEEEKEEGGKEAPATPAPVKK